MGLGITAFSHLTYVGHCPDIREDDHEYDPDTCDRRHVEAYAYDAFPHALMGVPDLRPLAGNSGSKFLTGGCFALTGQTETHGASRSYSGYNRWRKGLADQFNPYRDNGESPPSPEEPFYELIWFADNEGTICQLAAISLLANFRNYEAEYVAAHSTGDHFAEMDIQYYRDFLRCCELAADGGLIDFH